MRFSPRSCLPHPIRGVQRGAILLEVILALALFVAAATAIALGVNASVVAVDRMRLETHALNLASSVLAEVQMGARPMESVQEESLEAPFDAWVFALDLQPLETDLIVESLVRMEVTVRHSREPVVLRLAQLVEKREASDGAPDNGQGGRP